MVRGQLKCPACGKTGLDVCAYESMMVLRPNLALFTLSCPHCAARLSAVQPIPAELRDEVMYAAVELGAGMGEHKGTN